MVNLENLIELQNNIETGKIQINDISDIDYENLEKLYQMQIYQLDRKIYLEKKQLQSIKNEILNLKK